MPKTPMTGKVHEILIEYCVPRIPAIQRERRPSPCVFFRTETQKPLRHLLTPKRLVGRYYPGR